MNARAETTEQRLALHAALETRNRIVRILRIGVPLLGALIVAGFILKILIASLTSGFTIGRVTFSGGTMTVDTPSYSGIMANGDVYKLSAQSAQTSIEDLNRIDMQLTTLTLTKPDGRLMTASSDFASYQTIEQIVTVPGTMAVTNSDGSTGTLAKVTINLPRQTLKASGPVLLKLAGGATIFAPGLDYNAKTGLSDFGKARLTVADPGDAPVETPAEESP